MNGAQVCAYLEKLQKKLPEVQIVEPLDKSHCAGLDEVHLHSNWEILFLNDRIRVVPPRTLHASSRNIRIALEFSLLRITVGSGGYFFSAEVPPELSGIHLAPELSAMLLKIPPDKELFSILFQALLKSVTMLLKELQKQNSLYPPEALTDDLIAYLNTHYHNARLSSDDLAGVFGKTPQYLNRLIHAAGYDSIHTLLVEIRLSKAAEILAKEHFSVSETARLCGWNSPFYFSSRFRQKYKVSPKEYLKHAQSEESPR